jgi:type VI secretion system protein VasJ
MKNEFWRWAFCGKHPVARDFVRFGADDAAMKVFAEWIDQGFNMLSGRYQTRTKPVSWRLWVRGSRSGSLLCGLMRDSCDSIGRPYPLMILGSGPLLDWEDHWELLPLACEQTWNEIEYLSTGKFENLERLKKGIGSIKPPLAQWSDFVQVNTKKEMMEDELSVITTANADEKDSGIPNIGSDEIYFNLNKAKKADHFTTISSLHVLAKRQRNTTPHAMFAGGSVERSFLALFMRPLSSSDFVKLWTITETAVAEQA